MLTRRPFELRECLSYERLTVSNAEHTSFATIMKLACLVLYLIALSIGRCAHLSICMHVHAIDAPSRPDLSDHTRVERVGVTQL